MEADYYPPDSTKKLRSCKSCHIILSETQFKKMGCPNCIQFKNNKTSYLDYTSPSYDGFIAYMDKKNSFISKVFIREDAKYGCYCIRIIGD